MQVFFTHEFIPELKYQEKKHRKGLFSTQIENFTDYSIIGPERNEEKKKENYERRAIYIFSNQDIEIRRMKIEGSTKTKKCLSLTSEYVLKIEKYASG